MPRLTVDQVDAAELLGISVRSLQRGMASGEVPAVKVGRRHMVPSAWLCDQLGVESLPEPKEDHAPTT